MTEEDRDRAVILLILSIEAINKHLPCPYVHVIRHFLIPFCFFLFGGYIPIYISHYCYKVLEMTIDQ